MKKSWLVICILILTFIFSISVPVFADSGWDSDYSGSSGSSSSDWGGSSDWSGSSSWDDRDSSISISTNNEMVAILELIISGIAIFTGLFLRIFDGNGKPPEPKNLVGDNDVEIKAYFPNLDEKQLIDLLYKKFIEIQESWMNFDYDNLKKLCSDELYNSYESDLDILKAQNGQNIMNEFNLVTANIKGFKEENGIIIIDVYMHISFYDYVINTNTNEITKGTDKKKVDNLYDLEFIISKEINDICPNCGAKIEDISSGECSHCHSIITREYEDFVLSKKSRL